MIASSPTALSTLFECEYEASVLNQGPNQVHGTEMSTMNTMNRGLLVMKN